ncbi:hypothetical protein IQ247_13945 [Plectonema cf. radiosum LEGE 06105]|uniref:PAS domain-containing protein n=1 Tax=Plectonema cf. radiosum LEGE 06105 TaxID=945769 RepID=A0A8J7F459_9CYAN|nr:hypothetical protein [Plectonema radiosum]MBE9213753.1 hypothetical protein [Plectonema cf. radiosum LEGE 06105]
MNYLRKRNIQSNTNGILVVGSNNRRIVGLNRKFVEMWGFSSYIVNSQDENLALDFAALKLDNPLKFLTEVQEIYTNIELEIHDTIKLKDGRIFERHSLPQYLESKNVARLWMFRDITDEKCLKNLPEVLSNKILYFPSIDSNKKVK